MAGLEFELLFSVTCLVSPFPRRDHLKYEFPRFPNNIPTQVSVPAWAYLNFTASRTIFSTLDAVGNDRSFFFLLLKMAIIMKTEMALLRTGIILCPIYTHQHVHDTIPDFHIVNISRFNQSVLVFKRRCNRRRHCGRCYWARYYHLRHQQNRNKITLHYNDL